MLATFDGPRVPFVAAFASAIACTLGLDIRAAPHGRGRAPAREHRRDRRPHHAARVLALAGTGECSCHGRWGPLSRVGLTFVDRGTTRSRVSPISGRSSKRSSDACQADQSRTSVITAHGTIGRLAAVLRVLLCQQRECAPAQPRRARGRSRARRIHQRRPSRPRSGR
jgi:hypothetical protein